MSRSYKKHPFHTDHHVKTSKEKKRFANKKVRRTENVPSGNAFKKVYPTYEICDWRSRWSWEEAIDDWKRWPHLRESYPTLKLFYRYWFKCSRMK